MARSSSWFVPGKGEEEWELFLCFSGKPICSRIQGGSFKSSTTVRTGPKEKWRLRKEEGPRLVWKDMRSKKYRTNMAGLRGWQQEWLEDPTHAVVQHSPHRERRMIQQPWVCCSLDKYNKDNMFHILSPPPSPLPQPREVFERAEGWGKRHRTHWPYLIPCP